MPDLVADHRADRAIVCRRIPVRVEERELQDRGGEHDLVEPGVVVGVDGLRCHEPLVAVDRPADLAEFATELELADRPNIGDEIARVDPKTRVVPPFDRITDLGCEPLEFGQGSFAGLLGHPVEPSDALPVRLDQVADQFVHRVLRLGLEVALYVHPADGLPHRAFDDGDAALPSRPQLHGSGENASVEIEIRLHESTRKVRRVGADHLPAQPVAPGIEPGIGEQAREPFEEAGLTHDKFIEGTLRRLERVAPGVPDLGGGGGHVLPGTKVVGGVTVPRAHVVPVVRGEFRLQCEHALRSGGDVVQAGQREHPLDSRHVFASDLGKLFLAVVGLVGKAEPALLGEHEVAVRIARVVVDEQLHEPADSAAFEAAEQ